MLFLWLVNYIKATALNKAITIMFKLDTWLISQMQKTMDVYGEYFGWTKQSFVKFFIGIFITASLSTTYFTLIEHFSWFVILMEFVGILVSAVIVFYSVFSCRGPAEVMAVTQAFRVYRIIVLCIFILDIVLKIFLAAHSIESRHIHEKTQLFEVFFALTLLYTMCCGPLPPKKKKEQKFTKKAIV